MLGRRAQPVLHSVDVLRERAQPVADGIRHFGDSLNEKAAPVADGIKDGIKG